MSQPPFNKPSDWLSWQESLHPREIDLGLDRIREVAGRLNLIPNSAYVITVGGTNGKGSSVSMLGEACRSAGYRVAEYTSPHVRRYNERIRMDGQEIDDDALCQAFSAVDKARKGTSLTYFEFGTLAALYWFKRQNAEVIILEVGLGGRLDAVNILDADLALITNIGLDHQDWLGNTRAEIASEKAGIARPGKPVIYNDSNPVPELLTLLASMKCETEALGKAYWLEVKNEDWIWCHEDGLRIKLPSESSSPLQRENAAAVIAALYKSTLKVDLNRTAENIFKSIPTGRQQWIYCSLKEGHVEVLLDVAHNIESVERLRECLNTRSDKARNIAVFSALTDKPVEAISELMDDVIDEWHVGALMTRRGLSGVTLRSRMRVQSTCHIHETVESAWSHALSSAKSDDRVVVFGSFYTVEAVLKVQERKE